MAWTIGQPQKVGPQTLEQYIEIPFTSDSTAQTSITHSMAGAPQEFYVRSVTGGTHLCTLSANGLAVLVTPSTAATTGVVVVKSKSQAI